MAAPQGRPRLGQDHPDPRALRSLERDGLITRTVTPTVPVTVTYELTDLGLSLHQMMRGIKTWAETHMDDVLANREAYDTRTT
jgi:DNA-binding HxlR family transcriptional regulator